MDKLKKDTNILSVGVQLKAYFNSYIRAGTPLGNTKKLAGQFAGFAQQFPSQAFRELGAVQAIGEQKKDREQRALDIALSDFLTEQEFPTRQLQEYQSLIRGFPMSPNVFKQNVTSIPNWNAILVALARLPEESDRINSIVSNLKKAGLSVLVFSILLVL